MYGLTSYDPIQRKIDELSDYSLREIAETILAFEEEEERLNNLIDEQYEIIDHYESEITNG